MVKNNLPYIVEYNVGSVIECQTLLIDQKRSAGNTYATTKDKLSKVRIQIQYENYLCSSSCVRVSWKLPKKKPIQNLKKIKNQKI